MNNPACNEKYRLIVARIAKIALAIAFLMAVPAFAQQTPVFTPGNLVVAVEGCGVQAGTCTSVSSGSGTGGSYGDNQAAPITLFQYHPSGTASVTFLNSLALPQTGSLANFAISGEYGSSSEGTMHLSGQGQYLTLMGYGIDAPTFNLNPMSFGSNDPTKPNALAQSGSLTGQTLYTPVPRLVILVDPFGNVNSSTALYNVFSVNNPRSIFTADGLNAYVSGQGSTCDATGGVFYTPLFATNNTPIAITGLDAGTNPPNCLQTDAQDTRDVQIINNTINSVTSPTLYVSVDSKEGHSDNRAFIGTLGTPPATSLFTPPAQTSGYTTGPAQIPGLGNSGGTGKLTVTACGTNNASTNGNPINCVNSTTEKTNMSPENYFFASQSILYVADSGSPKNDSAADNSTSSTNIGDGGLQKWVNSKSDGTGTWSLAYTLWNGLNLVINSSASGTTGLYGLTGVVNGGSVLLYATNYAIGDLDPTYLYGITDNLSFTTASQVAAANETFTLLDTAPTDSKFRGLAFAPTVPAGGVEITSSPSGMTFTSSGTGCAPGTYTTPQILVWTPGSTCTLNLASTQNGATGVQYAFSQWSDGTNTNTNGMYTMTAPSTTTVYNASFTTNYLLTTSAGTGGSVSPGGYVASGTDATITATPSAGNYFVNFTGATTSTDNPLSLLMNGPQSITANFAPQVSQTISFTQAAPSTAPYNNTFTVSAQSTSGLQVVLSVDSGGSACSLGTQNFVSGVTSALVTMLSGTGTCTIDANQAGQGQYSPASQLQTSAAATMVQATFTFSALPGQTFGNAPFSVAGYVSTNSTGTVTFGLGASSVGCGVNSAGLVTITGAAIGSNYCVIAASLGADSNYSAAGPLSQSFQIAQATATINITGYSVPYDGTAHTATGTATGVGGIALSGLSLTNTTHTNAGTYATDPWTFTEVTGNYNSASGTVSDSISKLDATITVTPYSLPYNGTARTATGSVTGLAGVSLSGLDLSGTAHTNAGSYSSDPWTFADTTGNYNNASGTVSDSISKLDATITVTPYGLPYNATPRTATGSATGLGGVSLSGLNLSGTTHTNAGTYGSDPWTFTDTTGNYNNASGNVSDSISTINATIAVSGYSTTYDGNPHMATGTAMGAGGVSLSGLNLSGTAHTNAGNFASDPWTFTDAAGNYNNASGTVSDSIGKAAASISINNIPNTANVGGNFTVAYAYTGDGVPSVTSSTATCTVSPGGTVNFVGAGTCTLTARATAGTNYSAVIGGSQSFTISPAVTLLSIKVTPASPSIAKGLTQQFVATGTYSNSTTQDVTSTVTWASSKTSVATIVAAGLATGVGTGNSAIKATLGTISGSTTLTVTAATLQTIAVTPANPSIPKGTTQQFAATGTYTDGSTKTITGSVTWSSSDPSLATINQNGRATGAGIGTPTIEAMLGSVSNSTTLTVTAPVLRSINVKPNSASIAKGLTEQFTATGTYSDNSTQDVTSSVTWSSSNTAVATVGGTGVATGTGIGTSTIQGTLQGFSDSSTLTVTSPKLLSISVTPANPSLAKGGTLQFTATGTYTDNSTQNITSSANWSSSSSSVAKINASGLATGVKAGSTTIRAGSAGIADATILTVTP